MASCMWHLRLLYHRKASWQKNSMFMNTYIKGMLVFNTWIFAMSRNKPYMMILQWSSLFEHYLIYGDNAPSLPSYCTPEISVCNMGLRDCKWLFQAWPTLVTNGTLNVMQPSFDQVHVDKEWLQRGHKRSTHLQQRKRFILFKKIAN